jgi:hypothetical protein
MILIFCCTWCTVKDRMKSVGSIMKITKAMKMVSAAKLRAVQRLLPASRTFWVWMILGCARIVDLQTFYSGYMLMFDSFTAKHEEDWRCYREAQGGQEDARCGHHLGSWFVRLCQLCCISRTFFRPLFVFCFVYFSPCDRDRVCYCSFARRTFVRTLPPIPSFSWSVKRAVVLLNVSAVAASCAV